MSLRLNSTAGVKLIFLLIPMMFEKMIDTKHGVIKKCAIKNYLSPIKGRKEEVKGSHASGTLWV